MSSGKGVAPADDYNVRYFKICSCTPWYHDSQSYCSRWLFAFYITTLVSFLMQMQRPNASGEKDDNLFNLNQHDAPYPIHLAVHSLLLLSVGFSSEKIQIGFPFLFNFSRIFWSSTVGLGMGWRCEHATSRGESPFPLYSITIELEIRNTKFN